MNTPAITLLSSFFLVLLAGTGPPPVESKIIAGRRYESPFSVEELLNLVLPKKQSKDVDMDPCKSPSFIGDIAYPEGGNFTKKTKRRFRDNFDVRDTWSEPRLGRGLRLRSGDGKSSQSRIDNTLQMSSKPTRRSKLSAKPNSSSKLKTDSQQNVKKIMKISDWEFPSPKVGLHPDDRKILIRAGTIDRSQDHHAVDMATHQLIRHR